MFKEPLRQLKRCIYAPASTWEAADVTMAVNSPPLPQHIV